MALPPDIDHRTSRRPPGAIRMQGCPGLTTMMTARAILFGMGSSEISTNLQKAIHVGLPQAEKSLQGKNNQLLAWCY